MELRAAQNGVNVAVGHGDDFVLFDGSFRRQSLRGSLPYMITSDIVKGEAGHESSQAANKQDIIASSFASWL